MPNKILVIYAHSAPHQSRVNRKLAAAAAAVPGVTVLDLYETYPDFTIDVAAGQALLVEADAVVLVHPVQWYGMPALLKEWIDRVLQPGWACGAGGTALAGKTCWLAVTAGSAREAYAIDGAHGRPLEEFLLQQRQIAALCQMQWEQPSILYGAHQIDNAAVDAHVAAFRTRLLGFASPDLEPELD
jgi:putative NADPH-quinone reductase